jgi:uncharacterized protein YbaR (Trm112 family)
MYLLITDRLTCPHCGPKFGLILIADHLENRRILHGFFGCANCQARYPVRDGFGDLRPPFGEFGAASSGGGGTRKAESALTVAQGGLQGGGEDPDPEGAVALGAFLGLASGSGFILLTGRSVRHAAELAGFGEGFEILAAHLDLINASEAAGISRIAIGARFPFQSGSLRGVVLEGPVQPEVLQEGSRVLAPTSRLVLLDPGPSGRAGLEEAGLRVVAGDEKVLVGALK